MNTHTDIGRKQHLDELSRSASTIGYEIVDISGLLDMVATSAEEQRNSLGNVRSDADRIKGSNEGILRAIEALSISAQNNKAVSETAIDGVLGALDDTKTLATWVTDLSARTSDVTSALGTARLGNQNITSISKQITTLAINAKIEAARAGEFGRGFSVVADAVNELSHRTADAAQGISDNLETLATWILTLTDEAEKTAQTAMALLESTEKTNASLGEMGDAISETYARSQEISAQAETARAALQTFWPHLDQISESITSTSDGVSQAHNRVERLIDTSEAIVQNCAAIGASSSDARYIEYVTQAAEKLSRHMQNAVDKGQITAEAFFDQTYTPIPGSDPVQYMTAFTAITDALFPPVQEPALNLDPKVVFCAAVNRAGYLPTHNDKFSQPPSDDPVWNTANCRNRRIFDDRVGLKAGNNAEPFLVQVYRRDMGGGEFVLMKDISAPIYVCGRHWGGLRLAVKP